VLSIVYILLSSTEEISGVGSEHQLRREEEVPL